MIVWCVAGIVALVAGIIWGGKSGVQFSLSLIALKRAAGAHPRRLHLDARGDRRRTDHRRRREAGEFYWGPALGSAIENWFAYIIALVFLLFRPQGLFGEKIIERV